MRLSTLILLATASLLPVACATSVTSELLRGEDEGGGDSTTTTSAGGSGGAATTTTTTTSGGGGATGGGGQAPDAGPPGPCAGAVDCVGLADACNEGACEAGVCVKKAANENGGCDDGLHCTAYDSCHAGACSGVPTSCPSSDPCHIGSCDPAGDACTETPGNDGGNCDDGDPCTVTSFCAAGACVAGGQVDCSFADGPCSVGVCDPKLGCLPTPKNDGAACDDGLYCTVDDSCTKGACGGVPNTCAAPGDVCMIGTCDEVAKSCVAIPGNDGKPCDDQNACTKSETCSGGTCGGGVAANDGKACDDGDGCTSGTTCAAGKCANAVGQIAACIDGDKCCPANCQGGGQDSDCQICHPIGFDACPSGAKQWCTKGPIDPASDAQAKEACEQCYGATCYLENGDCAGPGYGPKPAGQYVCGDAYFGYQAGCSGDDGRVWSICSSNTTYGHWGK